MNRTRCHVCHGEHDPAYHEAVRRVRGGHGGQTRGGTDPGASDSSGGFGRAAALRPVCRLGCHFSALGGSRTHRKAPGQGKATAKASDAAERP